MVLFIFMRFHINIPGPGAMDTLCRIACRVYFFAPKSSSALLIIRKTQLLGP